MKLLIKLKQTAYSFKQAVAAFVSGIMTLLFCLAIPATQASDIEIYKKATAGTVTIMFLLDNSGSMSSSLDGTGLSRLERVRNGMTDLLGGADGVTALSDDKVIGLSTFYNSSAGYIMVPARALSTTITGGGAYTQKKPMVKKYYASSTSSTPLYSSCTAWSAYATCISWGTATTTAPSLTSYSNTACANVNSKTCTLYYTNTSVSVTDQRTLLLSYISTWSGNGYTPTANAYAEVGAYMLGTTTVNNSTITASVPTYFTYNVTTKTYYYRQKNSKYYSCNANGTTTPSTQNCNTSLNSIPADISNYTSDTTIDKNNTYYYKNSDSGTYYQSCTAYTSSGCATWGAATQTNPTSSAYTTSCSVGGTSGTCVFETKTFINTTTPTGSGFAFSTPDSQNTAKTAYISPINTNAAQCSGQGIYILTDGEPNNSSVTTAKTLMQNALTNSYSNSLTCSGGLLAAGASDTGWACIGDFSQLLRNRTITGSTTTTQMNPLNLEIKTAVVGFGSDFNGIQSYSSALTQQQNLDNISNAASASVDVKNAAKLGVYGGGGWYSGSSSSDVVTSVNNFITSLTTNIPAVTTGASYIPTDELNPSVVQNYAYSAQFQPTPSKSYQLWLGNLKKYNVLNGLIRDIKGKSIVDSSGTYVDNYDIWSQYADTSVDSNLALIGGVEGVLPVGMTSNVANRKLLTNRDSTGAVTSTTLNQIGSDYGNTTDPNRGYLLSLLGYAISNPSDTTNLPTTPAALATFASLRQVGAVMHSTPVLLTQSGTVTTANGVTSSSNRNDYVLFGTTQGTLSVVDANTGTEQFAFVPNELINTQKSAFLTNTATSGFSSSTYQPLYYGVDGAWTAYTEYVANQDGSLTVGLSDIDGSSAKGMQMVYGGLRMGGRSYYALDLQDISNPKMAFHIDPDNTKVLHNSSSTTYKELGFMGQSWSKPSVGWVKWKGAKRLVMFVGGGYDAGGTNGDGTFSGTTGERTAFSGYENEYDQASSSTNNKYIGAGVYMFDALTGELLWWAGANATSSNTTSGVQYTTSANMKYSVVSQIKTVDRNADGLIDHLYFGDLGGQVWRIDINNALTSTTDTSMFAKTPVRLLNLNNGKYSPRFYEMPAFSIYSNSGTKFGVLSIGSGNHSSPLFDTSDQNYTDDAIYNIYDKDIARSDLFNMNSSSSAYTVCTATSTTCTGTTLNTSDNTLSNLGKLTTNSNTTVIAPYSTTSGWYYYFTSTMKQDEKVLSTPIVLDYDLYVTSYDGSQRGSSGDCGSGVKGESYVTQFCMPYGVCNSSQTASSSFVSHTPIGVGIVAPSVGSTNATGANRALITSTGAVSGASGSSSIYSTSLSLIPQRWYEASK